MREWLKRKTGVKIGIAAFAVVTAAQWSGLYSLNQFLRAPELPSQAVAVTPTSHVPEKIQVPTDAINYAYSDDGNYLAYTTAEDDLIVLDVHGTVAYRHSYPSIAYLKWLDQEDTLCFFAQGTYLDLRLLTMSASDPVLVHEWYGSDRKVVNTFFSPYLEFLYVELQNGPYTEVDKYDAVGGVSKLPLGNVDIVHISYDAKTDVMLLTDAQGGVWKYAGDRLYRPDGSEVYDAKPPYHPLPEGAAGAALLPGGRGTATKSGSGTSPSTSTRSATTAKQTSTVGDTGVTKAGTGSTGTGTASGDAGSTKPGTTTSSGGSTKTGSKTAASGGSKQGESSSGTGSGSKKQSPIQVTLTPGS